MSGNDEYGVGYRKPPKASRWRKGQSGNPHGRQKGARNLKTELTEELSEIISVKEQGLARRITKQRALIKAMTAKAVQGDTRAANLLINIIFRLLRPELIEDMPPELTKEDQAILDTFEVRRRTDDEESRA
jgi:Family of unknown function (DUF5681)